MKKLILVLFLATAFTGRADNVALPKEARLVLAIRYLRPAGASHAHLFLYDGRGQMLRQLTKSSEGQDCEPVFVPDGRSVIFRRESNATSEFWAIPVDSGKPHRLTKIPSWYFDALKYWPRPFGLPAAVPDGETGELIIKDYATAADVTYPAPDGSTAIVLKLRKEEATPKGDFPKAPWLQQKGEPTVRVSQLPFTPLAASGTKEENAMRQKSGPSENYAIAADQFGDLDGVIVSEGSPFLWRPPLRVAFLRQHRGSTYGEGLFALDLNTRTLHEIAPTGGAIVAPAGFPGFFCVNRERCLPLGDGKRSVSCSFLDLWDARLQRTRFCDPKVAEFYGASLYLPGSVEQRVVFLPGAAE